MLGLATARRSRPSPDCLLEYTIPNGLLESVTRLAYAGSASAQQHETTYVRNAYGNVEQVIEEVASGAPSRATVVTYDDDDQIFPRTISNALGHTSQLRFDARWGAPKTMADANGIAVQHAYDDFGLLTTTVDPTGTSTYTYSGVLASSNTPAGLIQPRLQVSAEHQGVDGTHGGSSAQDLDNYGRSVRSRTEGFAGTEVVAEQSYDALGRVVSVALARAIGSNLVPTVNYTYDHLGRVIWTDRSDGSFTEQQYASVATLSPTFSNRVSDIDCSLAPWTCAVEVALSIDEEGRENAFVTDHRGNVIRSIDGNNIGTASQSSNYRYGAFNQLVEARDNRNLCPCFRLRFVRASD